MNRIEFNKIIKNKKRLTNEEVKQILLETMIHIDKVCKENNIQYSLAFGTLLGAVRHKGFIPWDDDIDICMDFDNYQKFISCFVDTNEYKLFVYGKQGDCFYNFAKISNQKTLLFEPGTYGIDDYGITIDVFPFVKLQTDFFDRIITVKKCVFYNSLLAYRRFSEVPIQKKDNRYQKIRKTIIYIATRPLSNKYLCRKMTSFYRNFDDNSEYYYSPTGKKIFDFNLFSEFIYLPFEGLQFPCCKEYERVLHMLYGNFMELPAEVNRVNHGVEAYWK